MFYFIRCSNYCEAFWFPAIHHREKHSQHTSNLTCACVLHGLLRCTMAVFLRRSLNRSRGTFALAAPAKNPRGVLPLGRLMVARPSLRVTPSSIPARTLTAAAPTASTTIAAVASDPAVDAEIAARSLEQELFKVLCEPRPSNPLLVALVRAMVQVGEQLSVEVVRAVARHFLDTRDTQSSKVSASCLRSWLMRLA